MACMPLVKQAARDAFPPRLASDGLVQGPDAVKLGAAIAVEGDQRPVKQGGASIDPVAVSTDRPAQHRCAPRVERGGYPPSFAGRKRTLSARRRPCAGWCRGRY